MATVEEVEEQLAAQGYKLVQKERLRNDVGFQLHFSEGEIVNVFDNGTVSAQGKNQEKTRELLKLPISVKTPRPVPMTPRPEPSRVFVVYGHDSNAKTQLEAMLRRWNCEPLILDQLPSEGQTIIEKLEKYTGSNVQFGVVLATPDDEGHEKDKADEKKFRARQNVVLELGLLLSKLGRAKVAILIKKQEQMERPSDIQGLIYLPFTDDVAETDKLLAKEMDKQGIPIEIGRL